MIQKQQQKEAAKQARAETRTRKKASGKENDDASAGLSTSAAADLLEAPQAQARLTTPNQVTQSASGSLPKVRQARRGTNKPMLDVGTDSEVLEAEKRRKAP
jgi:hypothetical protein